MAMAVATRLPGRPREARGPVTRVCGGIAIGEAATAGVRAGAAVRPRPRASARPVPRAPGPRGPPTPARAPERARAPGAAGAGAGIGVSQGPASASPPNKTRTAFMTHPGGKKDRTNGLRVPNRMRGIRKVCLDELQSVSRHANRHDPGVGVFSPVDEGQHAECADIGPLHRCKIPSETSLDGRQPERGIPDRAVADRVGPDAGTVRCLRDIGPPHIESDHSIRHIEVQLPAGGRKVPPKGRHGPDPGQFCRLGVRPLPRKCLPGDEFHRDARARREVCQRPYLGLEDIDLLTDPLDLPNEMQLLLLVFGLGEQRDQPVPGRPCSREPEVDRREGLGDVFGGDRTVKDLAEVQRSVEGLLEAVDRHAKRHGTPGHPLDGPAHLGSQSCEVGNAVFDPRDAKERIPIVVDHPSRCGSGCLHRV